MPIWLLFLDTDPDTDPALAYSVNMDPIELVFSTVCQARPNSFCYSFGLSQLTLGPGSSWDYLEAPHLAHIFAIKLG